MTTTRLSNRRGPPPHLHSPNSPQPSSSKPSVSLEEWESKAPLGELENTSVAAVKAAFDRPSLPFKFTVEEASSRASTPLRSVKFGPPSRSSTPGIPPSVTSISTSARFPGLSSATSTASTPHPYSHLHPTAPIQTPQQFYDWFALIDRSVAHSQESHFREHLKGVEDWLGVCEMLVGRIEEVDEEVEGMLKGWRSVEEGGRSLQEACQRLLEERDRLVELQDAIGQRLDYFQELEQATRMLNHPGDSLVLQTDFLYMVERVDVCIDFLKAHRHFREAELYLLRFQQCMTRAMTLIKMFFVGSLRALTQDITRRLSEKDVSSTAQQHLLYTRFQSVSHQLAPLLSELERRAASHPDQLSALLQECHTAWFAARKGIVVRRLVEEVRGLEVGRGELVEVTRAGCSYLKQLCTDEWELYRSFFDSGEEELYAYLESLCDYLYDDLRPRILHEQKLGALCEVCTVLQALMVLDGPSITAAESSTSPSASDSGSDDDSLEIVPDLPEDFKSSSKENGLGDLRISGLLRMVLQDAQTRLVFKAQSVMQSEIRWFIPNANAGTEELDWPGVLIRARESHDTNLIVKDKDSESIELGLSQIFQLSEATRRGVNTWYPTVRKTVWVLSQLFEFVQPAIFADLAQESLNLCRLSLISASEVIKSKSSFHSHSHSKSHSKSSASKAHAKSQSQIQSPPPPPHPTSPSTEIKTSPAGAELRDPETLIGLGKELDAVLFLARHLLILKEMARGLEGLMKSLEAEGGATGAAVKSVGGGYAFGGTNTSGFVGDGAVGVGAAGGLTGGSGMTDAFTSMLSRTSALIPDSLFESLGMPRGQESMLDARHGIDIDLRKACQDLIELVSSNATDPLYTYLAHAQRTASALILPPSTSTSSSSAFSANTTTSPPPTSSSSGMLPSDQSQRADTPLKSVEKEFVARCQTALKDSISRIRIYVEDQRTADVLIEHVRERVEDGWEVFREGVMQVQGEKQGKAEYCHEVALRLVLNSISVSAARYGRFIEPLLSLSIDFYVRIFVRIQTAPVEVKKAASKTSIFYVCSTCQSSYGQPLSKVIERESKNGTTNPVFKTHTGPTVSEKCPECGSAMHLAGPMWNGPIQDPEFVGKVLQHVESNEDKYGTVARMKGMLTVAKEELNVPFFFTPTRVSSFFHCNCPSLDDVTSALLNAGHQVSRSHACPGSIKTTASRRELFDIFLSWVKLHPVKMEKIAENSPSRVLLAREPAQVADFKRHPKTHSASSKVKLVRYQVNPTPNWGPGAKADAGTHNSKRKRDADE